MILSNYSITAAGLPYQHLDAGNVSFYGYYVDSTESILSSSLTSTVTGDSLNSHTAQSISISTT